MQTKLPIKSGGAFITDSNFDPMLFTESQARTFIKKLIDNRNKQFKKNNPTNTYREKLLSVDNQGPYFSYSSI